MLRLTFDGTLDLIASHARWGVGLFETIRISHEKPWRLAWHVERMAMGCDYLEMAAPPSFEHVEAHCANLVKGVDYGALRLVAVDAILLASAQSLPLEESHPVHIGLSHDRLRFSGNPLHAFKTLSYAENLCLQREATRRSLFDIIAPNEQGFLSDGGRTTLFVVHKGNLLTPPQCDGALPGIARRALLEAGLAEEARIPVEMLPKCEAAFVANALRGPLPVERVDGVVAFRQPIACWDAVREVLDGRC